MSNPEKPEQEKREADEEEPTGPSLTLLYSLLALALAAAIGFAVMIVLPFYRSRH